MRGTLIRHGRLAAWLGLTALTVLLAACGEMSQSAGLEPLAADREQAGAPLRVGEAGNFLAGRFAQDRHDQAAAATFLSLALVGNPDNAELLQRTFLAFTATGRLDEAADLARHLLTFDEEAAIAAVLVAERDAKQGGWADAEKRVAALPHRGFSLFIGPLVSAWARVGQGRIDEALEALAPLRGDPNSLSIHDLHAALINDLADRRKPAEDLYLALLAPSNRGLSLRTIEAAVAFFRRVGQGERADEIVKRFSRQMVDPVVLAGNTNPPPIASARSGLAEAFFGIAGSLRQGGAEDLALVFGRMALDLRPDFPMAQLMVADLLQNAGQLEAANAFYRAIAPTASVFWSAQLRVATNLDELGDVEAAAQALEGLLQTRPGWSAALVTLGDLWRTHKHWPEAIQAYDRAINAFPAPDRQQWAIFYSRGVALERNQQWAKAEADFLKALELAPDEPDVLNYLGYSWIEQGINLEQARKMIEKAVRQRPDDGFIVDSLGWAYFRAGDFARAVETIERAVELHPEDPTINDHFGDVLWSVGRRQEARFQWQRALVFNPEPDQKTEIERKLHEGLALSSSHGKAGAVR